MHRWLNLFNPRWWRFEWRYRRHKTPWDTHITPPEVMAFIEQTPPGRALDIGCGTGTNAITLTRHGWRVTAVDFSVKAIGSARRKAAAAGIDIDFRMADASDLSGLTGCDGRGKRRRQGVGLVLVYAGMIRRQSARTVHRCR